jgi:hypothetical protein
VSAGANRRRPALQQDATSGAWVAADPLVWGRLIDLNVKAAMCTVAYALPLEPAWGR